jgi:hypothetical protein
MSDLSPELNLSLAVDDDDLADYLVLSGKLRGSLLTLDGLFNATTGHTHAGSHQGGALGANAIGSAQIADGAVGTSEIADGSVTYIKLAANIMEALFGGTWINQATNYTVAAPIMWVFCTAAITVTLPAAASTNRPITVAAVTGNSTVASAGGSVIGGSLNTTTGAVTNGAVTAGDAFTFKSDGVAWRAV